MWIRCSALLTCAYFGPCSLLLSPILYLLTPMHPDISADIKPICHVFNFYSRGARHGVDSEFLKRKDLISADLPKTSDILLIMN